jgi:hypothetical protein
MRAGSSSRPVWRSVGACLALAVAMLVAAMAAGTASAATPQALVLNESVSGGAASLEAQRATADGFAVTVVTAAQWAVMTASDFAKYQLIIVGDPTCQLTNPVVSQNAAALASAVMGHASGGSTMAGNRVLIGTDPVFHDVFGHPGAGNLINAGVDFAGAQPGATGLYLDLTCGDPDWDGNGTPDVLEKLLPLLSISSNTWTENNSPPCGGSASLISNVDQFSIVHSSDLQGWSCSTHESFPTFPSDWNPLAVATDTPTRPTCGNDVDTGAAVCGEAYILIAGSGIVATAPNISLNPTSATNPVGTQHTVTATVTNPDNSPAVGVLVTFTVTGANAGASGTCSPADCKSDAAGKVTFTYTGTNAGDDTINASMTIAGSTQTATAAKKWVTGGGPPMCVLTATFNGPPKQIQITISSAAGLGSIVVTESNNADTPVPPFAVGATSPVIVTATKINQSIGSQVAITVTDSAGLVTKCDPVWPGTKAVQKKAAVKKAARKSIRVHNTTR